MLRRGGCTRTPALETLSLGRRFRSRNTSCGTVIGLLNAGYGEHGNALAYRSIVLWIHSATKAR